MRIKLVVCALCALAIAAMPAVAQAKHHHKAHHGKKHKKKHLPLYYLALGDSLAVGFQPFTSGYSAGVGHTTTTGYVDDLYAAEKPHFKKLHLEKLGCAGETTSSMMGNPASCTYGQYPNQLAAADAFLKQNKGQIAFVTIDIGANDIDHCVNTSTGAVNQACIIAGVNTINHNVPIIVKSLRAAAGKKVPIIGMTYYDPFLADWYAGVDPQTGMVTNSSEHSAGVTNAQESQGLSQAINTDLTGDYKNNGATSVAPVDTAFHTYDPMTETSPGEGPTLICQDTWMCAAPPVGPNIHANNQGYQLIAQTFGALKP